MAKPKQKQKIEFPYEAYIIGIGTDEVIFQFKTEKERDKAIRNKPLPDARGYLTTCTMCEGMIEPKKRLIVKLKDEKMSKGRIRNAYLFFCNQKCYDDYFSNGDDPDEEFEDFREQEKAIKEILKPQ